MTFLNLGQDWSCMKVETINKRINFSDIIINSNKTEMEFEFAQGTNSPQIEFRQAGSIKKNDFCMLTDQPCKIIELAVSKPGKHGTAKVCMTGTNIFTGKKIQFIFGTAETVMVPLVKKAELEVADIADDNYVSLVLPNNSLKEDVKLPVDRDEAKKLKKAFEKNKDESTVYFTIIKACGQEKITAARVEKISA